MEPIERLTAYTASQVASAKALDYVRALSCRHAGGPLAEQFLDRFPLSLSRSLFTKAAVAPGDSTTWGGPLAVVRPLQNEFVGLVREASLIGRLAGVRRVPFNVAVPVVTSGGTYGWIGAGGVKPVGALALAAVALGPSKACGILVVTEELMRLGAPGADVLLRDELVAGAAGFLDAQFIDPAVAAVANVNPASVTNGAAAIASSGPTAANAATDLSSLVRAFVAANPQVATAVIVLSPANALVLAASGTYRDLTMQGGFLAGVPVVTSAAAGNTVVMLDPSGILAALEDIEIDVAKSANVEMDSDPTDPPAAATVQVSLWQLNLVGLKVTAYANWKRARPASVHIVTGAAYV